MRKLGLIGGMSWVSTHRYYERISTIVRRRRGGHAAPDMVIESIDFSDCYRLQTPEEWQVATDKIGAAAERLEAAGAGMLLIGANAVHKVFREVSSRVNVDFLHIAESLGRKMAADGVQTAALLGTRSVMTESYYRRHLVSHGIDLLPPEMSQVDALERMIYDDLMAGKASRDAERAVKTMLTDLGRDGAQAVVLAAAELEMVVDIDATVVPIYDAMSVHAEAAAEWLLGEDTDPAPAG
ncbi:aspartate/glutamate racemase family protein [Aurantiacibacter luteus]|uniref:Aspartate racemase n=1 Tax=Aurantiacibacter luteus TaxID=1581420 RepID=A0A0G9MWQ9_9SPHN|nr:amino acid racemase [Aurantiacibacter luteus]KLE35212.1 aspartate racemase [Aurantiacibacter luteus]